MRKVAITIGLMVVMMVLRGAWAQTPTTLPAVTYGDANSGLAVGLGKAVSNEGELVVVVRNEGVLPASLE